jgi:hypothetical protein
MVRFAPAVFVVPAGSSGTAQNALSTALTISSSRDAVLAGNFTASRVDASIFVSGSALYGNDVIAPSTGRIGFTSALWFGTLDVLLARDAANTLALRNGTAAQAFNIYNTESASLANYERGFIRWTSNTFIIGTENLGTGVARDIKFRTNGSDRWQINTSGHFLADADNTYDIGASGANRPRDVYAGRAMVIGGASGVNNSGYLGSWSAGRIGFTNGATFAAAASLDTYISRSAQGILALTDAAELTEMTAPAAPAANKVRIYAEDNGSGKTRLMALFATGAAQQIAIEP